MQASSIAAVSSISQAAAAPRWTVAEVLALYEMPLMDLIWRAQGAVSYTHLTLPTSDRV